VSGPIQLHHGTADASVPLILSQLLYDQMLAAGKTVEFYTYEGDDHNLARYFSLAMRRSIEFFNLYVKGS
jgi:predicted esterase